jgi:hypothetical protein
MPTIVSDNQTVQALADELYGIQSVQFTPNVTISACGGFSVNTMYRESMANASWVLSAVKTLLAHDVILFTNAANQFSFVDREIASDLGTILSGQGS